MSEFKNYKNIIKYEEVEKSIKVPEKMKKFVLVLELKNPIIKDFTEKLGELEYEKDILDIINRHNSRNDLKNAGKFHLLEIKGLCVILGLEIVESYDDNDIGRYIGNYISKPLYNEKEWKMIVQDSKRASLFKIQQCESYKE